MTFVSSFFFCNNLPTFLQILTKKKQLSEKQTENRNEPEYCSPERRPLDLTSLSVKFKHPVSSLNYWSTTPLDIVLAWQPVRIEKTGHMTQPRLYTDKTKEHHPLSWWKAEICQKNSPIMRCSLPKIQGGIQSARARLCRCKNKAEVGVSSPAHRDLTSVTELHTAGASQLPEDVRRQTTKKKFVATG